LDVATHSHHLVLHSFPTRRSSDLISRIDGGHRQAVAAQRLVRQGGEYQHGGAHHHAEYAQIEKEGAGQVQLAEQWQLEMGGVAGDRKSTRLNSSHVKISYAVFCLK